MDTEEGDGPFGGGVDEPTSFFPVETPPYHGIPANVLAVAVGGAALVILSAGAAVFTAIRRARKR